MNIIRTGAIAAVAAAFLAAGATAPVAQGVPEEAAHGGYLELGKSKDWTAIRFQLPDGSTVCAIYSKPVSSDVLEGSDKVDVMRGERAAFITWEDGSVNAESGVVSFLLGLPAGSPADGNAARVDNKTAIALYGFEDRLYPDPGDDVVLTATMRKGMSMAVEAVLAEDRTARDVYSLRGVQRATGIAAEACKD